MPGAPDLYRDFYYPLNVFMHILTHEEGSVSSLHYGLFNAAGDSIAAAQERSTELLLSRLPPPPARLLEVGIGLGTTLRRLTAMGYDACGITPDEKQIAMVRKQFGDSVNAACAAFETFQSEPRDVIVFQESSQYIDAAALFDSARAIAPRVLVLDEFALRPLDTPGALHALTRFVESAAAAEFSVVEEIDLSEQAAPTIDYFNERLPAYRDRLIEDLGLTSEQVDDLIASGRRYRELYRDGTYGYRLLDLRRR